MRNRDSRKTNNILKYTISAILITGITVAIYFIAKTLMSQM